MNVRSHLYAKRDSIRGGRSTLFSQDYEVDIVWHAFDKMLPQLPPFGESMARDIGREVSVDMIGLSNPSV